jgi:hypothetical protein
VEDKRHVLVSARHAREQRIHQPEAGHERVPYCDPEEGATRPFRGDADGVPLHDLDVMRD